MMTMVRGGTELLQDPVAQELLASRIPARLAYNWTDGIPRVVSIWFHWNGSDIVMALEPAAGVAGQRGEGAVFVRRHQ